MTTSKKRPDAKSRSCRRKTQPRSGARMSARAAILILLLIFPWPIDTDPSFMPAPRHAAIGPKSATDKTASKPSLLFDPQWSQPIDREAFLISFRRQARSSLQECLDSEPLAAHSFSASATLTRKGKLLNLKLWSATGAPPVCAKAMIAAMNFASLTHGFRSPWAEIQWRIDW